MLVFLGEIPVNATSAFYTVRLKQRLPKHPCTAMQRTRRAGVDVRSLTQLSSHSDCQPLKLCSNVTGEH